MSALAGRRLWWLGAASAPNNIGRSSNGANRGVQTTSFCLSLDGAIKESYQVFVSGEGFPEDIVMPDQVKISVDNENGEEGTRESLSALWDQWLEQHPDERAE